MNFLKGAVGQTHLETFELRGPIAEQAIKLVQILITLFKKDSLKGCLWGFQRVLWKSNGEIVTKSQIRF